MTNIQTEASLRQFATDFCDRISSPDPRQSLDLYADDAVLTFMSRAQVTPLPFPRTKAELADGLTKMASKAPPRMICQGFLVDGNKVAIEAVSDVSMGPASEPYRNTYVFILIMKDGKIVEMREYMDTLYAKEAFAQLRPA